MRRSIVTVMAPAALLAVSFGLAAKATANLTARSARKPAPEFTLPDSSGAAVKLSAYKGRVVLLDFWATWCTGCKTEIPWYMEFQDRYKDAGLSAIGVSLDEDGWKSVKPFLHDHNINYPIVVGDSKLAGLYGITAMPVTLLIDRDGKIAGVHAGLVEKTAFEREIQGLLKEGVSKSAQ
jgi:peroxiredoxin